MHLSIGTYHPWVALVMRRCFKGSEYRLLFRGRGERYGNYQWHNCLPLAHSKKFAVYVLKKKPDEWRTFPPNMELCSLGRHNALVGLFFFWFFRNSPVNVLIKNRKGTRYDMFLTSKPIERKVNDAKANTADSVYI